MDELDELGEVFQTISFQILPPTELVEQQDPDKLLHEKIQSL